MDYFSLARPSPRSPNWPRLPSSPTAPLIPLSSSNSSRGSWSSLFNSGSVRQFMTGVQDTLKEGLTTPEILQFSASSEGSIPVRRGDRTLRGPDSPASRRRGYWKDSSLPSPSTGSKSWNETLPTSAKGMIPFSSAGHRRSVFSQLASHKPAMLEKRIFVFDEPRSDERSVSIPNRF